MVILLFLQVSLESNFKMEFAYPLFNLTALHPGFLNPAVRTGIVGSPTNPASINDINHGEVFIAYTPSISTRFRSDFIIPIEDVGSIADTINLPVNFCFEERGNFDLLGFGLRRGRWAFGLATLRGDYLRLDLDTKASVYARHKIEFEDTLTSEVIPGIPQGEKIPVSILLSGEGRAKLECRSEGLMESQSFIICAGTEKAGLDVGFGLQIEPVRISANLGGNLSGSLDMSLNSQVSSQSTEWTVGARFGGEIMEDSLLAGLLDVRLNGWLIRFVTGFKKNWRFLDVGLAYHFLFPTSFNGNLQYQYLYPKGIPEIEIEDEELEIDTLNRRITGSGRIIIKDFPMEKEEGIKELNYSLEKGHGLFGGIGLKIFFIEIAGFAGGLVVPDGSYARLIGGANFGLKTFIPIYATAVVHYQTININGIPIGALPVIGVNVGTNFKIRNLRTYLGAGLNTTQGVAALYLPEMIEGKKTEENIIRFKVGLGYEF